jgi:hypothetical protein
MYLGGSREVIPKDDFEKSDEAVAAQFGGK